MNRYLFLDIDGCLCSERTVFAYKKLVHAGLVKYNILTEQKLNSFFDPISVLLLKNAQEQIGFKIVISSTWRFSLNLLDFHILFSEYDWDTTNVTIGKTGEECGSRGQQIQNWLNNHAKFPYKYAILDDSSDMLESQKENFVQTNFENGLDFEAFKKIFQVFGEQYEEVFENIFKE